MSAVSAVSVALRDEGHKPESASYKSKPKGEFQKYEKVHGSSKVANSIPADGRMNGFIVFHVDRKAKQGWENFCPFNAKTHPRTMTIDTGAQQTIVKAGLVAR